MSVCVVTLVSGTVFTVAAQKKVSEMTEQEKRQKLQELEQKKQELEQKKSGQAPSLNSLIDHWEEFLYKCSGSKIDRCADAMYTLSSLYYDQAKEQANRNQTKPDYRKSLNMYWLLAREYPQFEKLPEAYLQMSMFYLLSGNLDTTRIVLELLVNRFPNSPRASSAHFRLADFALLDNNYNKAYGYFSKIKRNEVDLTTWEITHYRMGECAYKLGDFDNASKYLRGYVDEYDKGTYKKKEYRDKALGYIRKMIE
jgi:tetratricopeptide (TPR) repeat protein